MGSGDLLIELTEIAVGVARRACPSCSASLVIRMGARTSEPIMRSALELGYTELTVLQREIFDTLYVAYPNAIPRAVLEQSPLSMTERSIIQAMFRLKYPLKRYGWRIIARNRTLRLVKE